MALTGAKPFLKNISKEIHSKALADNTRTILSLKTERNTCGKNTYCKCKHHGESPSFQASNRRLLFPLDGESQDEEGAVVSLIVIVCASQNSI